MPSYSHEQICLRAFMCKAFLKLFFGNQLSDATQTVKECSNLCEDYSSIITSQLVGAIGKVCDILSGKETLADDLVAMLCTAIKNDVILTYNLAVYAVAAVYMNRTTLGDQILLELRKRKTTVRQLIPFCQMNQMFLEDWQGSEK